MSWDNRTNFSFSRITNIIVKSLKMVCFTTILYHSNSYQSITKEVKFEFWPKLTTSTITPKIQIFSTEIKTSAQFDKHIFSRKCYILLMFCFISNYGCRYDKKPCILVNKNHSAIIVDIFCWYNKHKQRH